MPTFDIVSEVDWQEVTNALDQANREISNRYDFKGTDARVERKESLITLFADDEFQVGQATDILHSKMAKRKIDLNCLQAGNVQEIGSNKAKLEITVRHGIDQDSARRLVKQIKGMKLKVQASIQGEQVRVSAKKRDDLQQVITELRGADFVLPLQYINFRD